MKYNYEYEQIVSTMKMQASQISSSIIVKHMTGGFIDYKKSINELKPIIKKIKKNHKLELYNDKNNIILGEIKNKLTFENKLFIIDDTIYLVYDGTYGHLNVKYIVLRNNHFLKNNGLLSKTLYIFISIFLFMALVGYFLAKLFLKPILLQRKKLDMFIKDTTHELNTPITSLLMSINKKDQSNPNNKKRIQLSAKRISEIYNDLTYLFLRNNEFKKLDELNLKPILEDNLEYFQEIATRKKINIIYQIDYINYKIDKESFTRLTNNLISNAIKYTNIYGNIEIKLINNQFIIKDDGIGIEKHKQKEIFDRFYRATSTSGGFGIGLNIVSSICEEFNIEISLISNKDEGSTFILSFK